MHGDYALVLTCEAFEQDHAVWRALLEQRLQQLPLSDGIAPIELFSPHPDFAAVPFFRDGPPPVAIVECRAQSLESLRELAASEPFQTVFRPAQREWSAGLFQILSEPIAGASRTGEREAPVSFVVRYNPPVKDAKHFAEHYVANHPAILARFPRIRNVLCYVPLSEPVRGFRPDETVIRNEVVFDCMADLVSALHSPVLSDLRADSKTFPPFGSSTHHAMLRTRRQ